MNSKEYTLPNGKKAVFEYDVCGIGKITLECMDELMAMIADRPQGEVDAIDRDALIDYCLKLIDVERKQGSDVMNYGQERVNQTEAIIDYIEHMPHINTDRPQREWIPCSKRLPKASITEPCMMTIIFPRAQAVEVAYGYRHHKDVWEYATFEGYEYTEKSIAEVIAWMPLPKPWKGAGDE